MIADKKTIGLTPENESIMDHLMTLGLFNDKIEAAKFALALAINRGIKPGALERAETVWNVGSFDSDGHLRNLIPALFPGTELPYRAVESLLNAGIEIIGQDMAAGREIDVIALMTTETV
jgi:hypothetical protein